MKKDKRYTKTKEERKQLAKKAVDNYKTFALKGNVLDMAIGVIIGGALTTIVNTLVSSTITPIISLFTSNVDLSKLFITLRGGEFETLEQAKSAGAIVLSYGELLNAIVNFFIITIILFVVISILKKSYKKDAIDEGKKVKESTKDCPFCFTKIINKATRCPYCTSILDETKNSKES